MLLKPKTIVIKIIMPEIIFCPNLFLYLPKTAVLLTTHNKNNAIIGNRKPLATCANFIISIGLNCKDENTTPNSNIKNHTILNLLLFKFAFQPKQLFAT